MGYVIAIVIVVVKFKEFILCFLQHYLILFLNFGIS